MKILKDLKLKNQLIVSTYIMIFILLVFKPAIIPNIYNRLIGAFKPFIVGGVIAFLINIPMKLIEENIIKPLTNKHRKLNKLSRIISLIITIIIATILIATFINYIVPQLIESIKNLTESIPEYITSLQNYVTTKLGQLDIIKNIKFDVNDVIEKFVLYVANFMNKLISNLLNVTFSITNFFINLFLGIIIAIYILLGKERLAYQFKKVLYAFFSEKRSERILYVLKLINYKFSRFILGQSTDGLILGSVFFIVFSLFKIPYAMLISIMIPILNFIPIFGTYIGIIISVFIIFIAKPSSVILFLVSIVIIQQLDGKFIYPVVVGNSLGLSSLWILLAIIVGGNLFGILGMILGMPLVSVIYDLFSDYVNKTIEYKKLYKK
jgi:predicted PurR-regulated permease PerM